MKLIIPLILAAVAAASPALAQRGEGTVEPIRFKSGQACWRYTGTSFAVEGHFRAGDEIMVTSVGEEYSLAQGTSVTTLGQRQLEFVDGLEIRRPDSEGRLKILHDGLYSIEIVGAVHWGSWGSFAVCRLRP